MALFSRKVLQGLLYENAAFLPAKELSKVVLYGCDGSLQAVESMPARGFIYPSE
jgi:hypothetical protein